MPLSDLLNKRELQYLESLPLETCGDILQFLVFFRNMLPIFERILKSVRTERNPKGAKKHKPRSKAKSTAATSEDKGADIS